jgi:hypothetical protein
MSSRLTKPQSGWRTGVAITAGLPNNTVYLAGTAPFGRGIYVKITTAGALGTAQFAWGIVAEDQGATAGVLQAAPVATAASVALSCGATVNFANVAYVLGDMWLFWPE